MKIFRFKASLKGSLYEPLYQGSYYMCTKKALIVFGSLLIGALVAIQAVINKLVAGIIIGSDRAAWCNVIEDECFHRKCRAIQCDMKANTTYSFFQGSSFNSNGNDGLAIGPTASLASLWTANEEFIHFNAARKLFPFMTNGAASEFLQPGPGGAIATKA